MRGTTVARSIATSRYCAGLGLRVIHIYIVSVDIIVPGECLYRRGPDVRMVVAGRAVTKQGFDIVVWTTAELVVVPHFVAENPQGGGADSFIRVTEGTLTDDGARVAVQSAIFDY
jgi:hypothetical protein